MRWLIRFLSACVWLAGLACTTTDYALYLNEESLGVPGGDSSMSSGGTNSSSGGGSLGGSHANECDVMTTPPRSTLVHIYSPQLGLCFSQGKPQELMGNAGFALDLVSCANTPQQLWAVTEDDAGALKFTNDQSGFNLDVRFADSTAGTPFVLYGAHGLYNQRFRALPGNDQKIQFSPRHTQGMCAEADRFEVHLESCDINESLQFFELVHCGTN